ncbi:hypothetical protein HK105_200597 [Polyrhizophydium stewartii]|uniref:Uncharacterized protein n=1 Tax=Polyrhizophydium stewartii TaxID=2732419 RepID=A0ABR4NJL1_9FUNG
MAADSPDAQDPTYENAVHLSSPDHSIPSMDLPSHPRAVLDDAPQMRHQLPLSPPPPPPPSLPPPPWPQPPQSAERANASHTAATPTSAATKRISTAPTSHTTVVLAPAPKASLVTHCNSQSLDASVATLFGHLADTYRLYLTQTLAEVRMRVTAVTNDRPHADIVERAVRQRIERTHTFAAKIQRLQAACEREFGLLSER